MKGHYFENKVRQTKKVCVFVTVRKKRICVMYDPKILCLCIDFKPKAA